MKRTLLSQRGLCSKSIARALLDLINHDQVICLVAASCFSDHLSLSPYFQCLTLSPSSP